MPGPRVVIDARMVGPVGHGIATYVTRLAEGLDSVRERGGLAYEPVFLVAPGMARAEPWRRFAALETGVPFLSAGELWRLPPVIARERAALYHSPSFSSLLWCPAPSVVTIHDLNHLTFGDLARRAYYGILLKRFARRSRAVLTVSEFSRREISRWLGWAPERVELAPNALTPELARPVPEAEIGSALAARGLERGRYFLALSSAKPHKNLPFLVEAYARARAEAGGRPWPLVLTVSPGEIGGSEGVREVGSIGQAEVRALLAGAGALAFPSVYEGFGLPPVEAVVAGIPVLASRIPPHVEALGGGPRPGVSLLDPRDGGEWTRALAGAMRSGIAAPPKESGRELLERFSVAALGERMDAVYRRVLQPKMK